MFLKAYDLVLLFLEKEIVPFLLGLKFLYLVASDWEYFKFWGGGIFCIGGGPNLHFREGRARLG